MAQPAKKSEGVEQFLNGAFKVDRKGSINQNKCIAAPMGCGLPATEFKDAISAKEYTISGFCQKCQDRVFG